MDYLKIVFIAYLVFFAIALVRTIAQWCLNRAKKISSVKEEPIVEVEDIQGDSLLGFNKPYRIYACYTFSSGKVPLVKEFLQQISKKITSAADILKYRKSFRAFREQNKSKFEAYKTLASNPYHNLQTCWLNVSFSYDAMYKLTAGDDKILKPFKGNAFTGPSAFENGLQFRATGVLNDRGVGAPENWIEGFRERNPDLMLHIATDNETLTEQKYNEINELAAKHGLTLVYKQMGNVLKDPSISHYDIEHFGFSDGVSQPTYRGLYKDEDGGYKVIYQRKLSENDPHYLNYSTPGYELTWPGDLILGYPTCDRASANPLAYVPPSKELVTNKLAKNGSFAVMRILKQDVVKFWKAMDRFSKKDLQGKLTPDAVAAKCVGRWKGATPLVISPKEDIPQIGDNDNRTNAFFYEKEPITFTMKKHNESFKTNQPDPKGLKCPIGAHIRRSEPRDQPFGIRGIGNYLVKITNFMFGNLISTQDLHIARRLARRAIPYGKTLLKPDNNGVYKEDGQDRGLIFVCYQASIENQFEFVQAFWCNNDQFPTSDVGHDMIVGQSLDGKRYMVVPGANGENSKVETNDLYVIPRGGGYFFTPSISAIKEILAK